MSKSELQRAIEKAARRVIAGEAIDILRDAILDIDAHNRLASKRKERESEFKARQLDAFGTSGGSQT